MKATNEQVDKIMSSVSQAATDVNNMMRDSVNAVLQSMSIMVKGYGDLSDNVSNLVQKSIEQSVRVSQTMLSATSVSDIVDTQNNVIKNGFDSIVSDITNISQLSSRIAQQAVEPVTKHVNDSISKISKIKAA